MQSGDDHRVLNVHSQTSELMSAATDTNTVHCIVTTQINTNQLNVILAAELQTLAETNDFF